MLRMTRLAEKSGHRTVRIIFDAGAEASPQAQAVLNGVNALGASYEGMTPRYLSVDIPPGVDLMTIARFLTDSGIQWEHADPRYAELHPDES